MSEGLGGCYPIIFFWRVTVKDTCGFCFAARSQEVISKGRAAQDVSKVGVRSVLVWGAAVLVSTAPYVEPSKEWFHVEQEEKGR
eukprot:75019-Pelagomonas_calceolata.AAC.1